MSDIINSELYKSIADIINRARTEVTRTVNTTMLEAYWCIGRLIVEEQQQGVQRAEYATSLLEKLAIKLSNEFGAGFDASNLRRMRQFYLSFSIRGALQHELNAGEMNTTEKGDSTAICGTSRHVSAKTLNDSYLQKQFRLEIRPSLSWTHYRKLLRVEKPAAREWYMNEAADQNWSTRALERQINSLYYERLLSSSTKEPVITEADGKTTSLKMNATDYLKDPYVLEFLNLSNRASYRESEFEQAIIDKLQEFLLELGKGFAFVARQKRISTETKNFYIDLVFYNYHLKCFVLIDLKTGELTHQDVGQMDMYVRMFDKLQRAADDNPTVGLILCTEKDETIVKYSILEENRQLFASKYMLYLPNEEELRMEMEREKQVITMEMQKREEE
jgi:predicted nuclease of restriction endonuclease-like (RecB) superfamily